MSSSSSSQLQAASLPASLPASASASSEQAGGRKPSSKTLSDLPSLPLKATQQIAASRERARRERSFMGNNRKLYAALGGSSGSGHTPHHNNMFRASREFHTCLEGEELDLKVELIREEKDLLSSEKKCPDSAVGTTRCTPAVTSSISSPNRCAWSLQVRGGEEHSTTSTCTGTTVISLSKLLRPGVRLAPTQGPLEETTCAGCGRWLWMRDIPCWSCGFDHCVDLAPTHRPVYYDGGGIAVVGAHLEKQNILSPKKKQLRWAPGVEGGNNMGPSANNVSYVSSHQSVGGSSTMSPNPSNTGLTYLSPNQENRLSPMSPLAINSSAVPRIAAPQTPSTAVEDRMMFIDSNLAVRRNLV